MRNDGSMGHWLNTKKLILNFETLVARLKMDFLGFIDKKDAKSF